MTAVWFAILDDVEDLQQRQNPLHLSFIVENIIGYWL